MKWYETGYETGVLKQGYETGMKPEAGFIHLKNMPYLSLRVDARAPPPSFPSRSAQGLMDIGTKQTPWKPAAGLCQAHSVPDCSQAMHAQGDMRGPEPVPQAQVPRQGSRQVRARSEPDKTPDGIRARHLVLRLATLILIFI